MGPRCRGPIFWKKGFGPSWTQLEWLAIPSGMNFFVFLSVQTSVLSYRKQFLLLISPVFVRLPGRSLD